MKTKVCFRRFLPAGDVIALFPEIPADMHAGHCQSYQHIGQHGAASADLAPYTCRVSMGEPDVAALKSELERIGYALQPVTRITQAMHRARIAAMAHP